MTLWCDGLKEREQEKRCLRAYEDREEILHPAKKRKSKVTDEKRDSVVEDTVQTLKKMMEKVSLQCSIEYGWR